MSTTSEFWQDLPELVWTGFAYLVLIGLIRPIRPFRSRTQAGLIGLPALLAVPLILASLAAPPRPPAGVNEPSAAALAQTSEPAQGGEDVGEIQQISETAPKATETSAASMHEVQFEIAALTHMNTALNRRVTYREPLAQKLEQSELKAGAWTIEQPYTNVICFNDGNNAIFFIIDGRFYAANGKARQFVRFEDGDGIVLASGELRAVEEIEPGKHADVLSAVRQVGLELCGQKSVDEISEAVVTAVEPVKAQPVSREDALMKAALAIKGAEICRYSFDPVPVVDYLEVNGVDKETYAAEIDTYLALAKGIFDDADGPTFCQQKLLPEFGPDGLKFMSE